MQPERDALFMRLYKEHQRVARRVIWRVLCRKYPGDVDDVLQTTFIKCRRAFNPALHGGFRHWFVEAAKRNAITYLQSEGVIRTSRPVMMIEMGEAPPLAQPDADGRERLLRLEEREILIEAISAIENETRRRICHLRFIEAYGYPQIALALNVPIGTVMSSIHRATPRITAYVRARLEIPDPSLGAEAA